MVYKPMTEEYSFSQVVHKWYIYLVATVSTLPPIQLVTSDPTAHYQWLVLVNKTSNESMLITRDHLEECSNTFRSQFYQQSTFGLVLLKAKLFLYRPNCSILQYKSLYQSQEICLFSCIQYTPNSNMQFRGNIIIHNS